MILIMKRTLLSGWLLDLAGNTNSDQSVVWLELLQCLWGIVNEGESGSLSTTELGLEAENVDLLLGALVELSELAAEVILGDIGAVWVKDVTIQQLDLYPEILHSIPFACVRADAELLIARRSWSGLLVNGTYMTICLRPKRGLRMNLRVRSVTGCSRSAILTKDCLQYVEDRCRMEFVVRSLAFRGSKSRKLKFVKIA
jgi:hypothetical protein